MAWFLVSTRGGKPAAVEASNWLSALGNGLEQLGAVASIDRLACEVLANGTVLVRDVRTGQGFVVQPREASQSSALEEPEEMLLMPADTEGTTSESGLQDDPAPVMLADPLSSLSTPQLTTLLSRIESTTTTAAAWRVALEGARALIPAESVSALARDWDGTLRFVDALGPTADRVIGREVPAGQGIAGFCVLRQVSLIINEPHRDPRFFATMDRVTGYRTVTLIAAPVCYEGSLFGCLEMLNAPEAFTQEHLELISIIADSLAEQLLVVG
ncbi:MAG: GAF domain-containing protein [Myxococcota bacterium]|nr:GAF domain-containing protein [Myxococcota bacterium]